MLSYEQTQKIKQLLDSCYPAAEIVRITGLSAPTVYKYIKILKGGPDHDKKIVLEESNMVSKKVAPYVGFIEEQLEHGSQNTAKLYQKLTDNGFVGSYGLVNDYVKSKHGGIDKGRERMYQRVETDPGEQAQVDWGTFGKINVNGRTLNLYVFVYVLSYSRAMYAEFATSQKQRTFQECHIHAFNKLGAPKKIRYDNVKTVVISRKRLPEGGEHINYNFDFSNFAKYYKFEPEICPPYYPRSKGKVEAGVKYLRYNFMEGEAYKKTFKSIDELNQKVWSWLDNIANNRIHSTTKERPIDRWNKERDKLFITKDYPLYQNNILTSRRASQNSMVTFKRSSYWVPNCYARKKIDIIEINNNGSITLRFLYRGSKIIEYLASNKPGEWILPKNGGLIPDQETVGKKKKKRIILHTEVQERDLNHYNKFINL